MGALKAFASEVSYVMGLDGELTDDVLRVAAICTAAPKPSVSENKLFVEYVLDRAKAIQECQEDYENHIRQDMQDGGGIYGEKGE